MQYPTFYHVKCYRSGMVNSKENVTEGVRTMPQLEPMEIAERYRYLRRIQTRYREADRSTKWRLLKLAKVLRGSTTLNRGRPKRGAQGASQPQIRGNGGAKSPYFA